MTAPCDACGNDLPAGAVFCPTCGQRVSAPACVSCGAELTPQAQFCMICGTPVAAAAPGRSDAPVASRRLTSILFGDLVGFTTLSEARDTEDVRELLARYFDECRRIVERYGGTIEKFIGDAVMAVWGVPVSQEDDAERAVRAGLELVAAVTQFGEEVGAPQLALRVGVVTGEVAVTIGATQQGMVAGDPVNTAARVQSAASPGQVWVDETTRLLTTAAISYVDVGSHALKGKGDPVPLWAVRAVVAAVGGAQRADGLEAQLVGRDRELRLMKELFHRAEESKRPVLLVVEGEAGVGKSRLGWEFEKYIDGLNTLVRWHSSRAVAYGEGVAFFAIAEAVRGRLRALADDPEAADEEDISVQLERGLERYVPEADRDWIRPRLGTLLGIGSVGTFVRDELFSAWTTWFEDVAEDQTFVLVIDDGQDADEGTLLFVEHLAAHARVPLFQLLLTRSGLITSRPSLITRPGANVMNLDTLAPAEMAELLDGLVPGLPATARAQLVERAEGVPLFAVETIRSLIDRDLVVPRGGEYVLADGVSLDVDAMTAPASLHALVAARLDTLSAPQRYVVDRASVLGQTFTPEALAGICGDIDVEATLADLVHLQILALDTSRISATYGHYRFVQSVVRQVAYGTLSRRDRKAVHLAVVTTLEATGAEGDDTAAIRAQHYLDAADAVPTDDDVAVLRAAALDNLRRAATRALGLGSPAEAARHLELALGLTDDAHERGRLLTDIAFAESESGAYPDAIEHAREGLTLLERAGDRVGAGRAAAVVASALSIGMGNHEGAVAAAQPWWDELRDRRDAQVAQMALSRALLQAYGRLHLPFQDVAEARMRIAEREGDRGAMSETYNMLSVHYSNAGIPSLGAVLLEASADIARSAMDLPRLGHILTNQAAGQLAYELTRAVSLAEEAVSVCTRSGNNFTLRFAFANQALGLWHAGRWDELDGVRAASDVPAVIDETIEVVLAFRAAARGEPWEPRELPALEDVDDQQVTGWRALLEAAVSQVENDVAAALTKAMEAVEVFYADSGVWDDLPHAWIAAAHLALEVGDEPRLDRLVGIVESEAARVPPALQAHLQHVLGTRAAHRDDPAAEALLRGTIERYTAWGSLPYVARTEVELARWLTRQGRADEARELLDQARATYTALGAHRWLAQLDGTPVPSSAGSSS